MVTSWVGTDQRPLPRSDADFSVGCSTAMAPDDLILIESLQAGDESAFEEIMARYRGGIFGFAFRQLYDESAAADVTQETFVRVYLNRAQFKPTGTFRSWLYRIASNLCVDHIRKSRRSPTSNIEVSPKTETGRDILDFVEAPDAGPDEASALAADIAELKAEILLLPAALREPLVLFALEERSQQECAEILGISAKAVESKVARARDVLRQRLARRLR